MRRLDFRLILTKFLKDEAKCFCENNVEIAVNSVEKLGKKSNAIAPYTVSGLEDAPQALVNANCNAAREFEMQVLTLQRDF